MLLPGRWRMRIHVQPELLTRRGDGVNRDVLEPQQRPLNGREQRAELGDGSGAGGEEDGNVRPLVLLPRHSGRGRHSRRRRLRVRCICAGLRKRSGSNNALERRLKFSHTHVAHGAGTAQRGRGLTGWDRRSFSLLWQRGSWEGWQQGTNQLLTARCTGGGAFTNQAS